MLYIVIIIAIIFTTIQQDNLFSNIDVHLYQHVNQVDLEALPFIICEQYGTQWFDLHINVSVCLINCLFYIQINLLFKLVI